MQLKHEQRESPRYLRDFWVTDHEDEQFAYPLAGHDVSLTGISFWLEEPDLFLPDQTLSLRVKNSGSGEVYCLDGVRVVHVHKEGDGYLCGCHITQVTSSELLAHYRLEMAGEDAIGAAAGSDQVESMNEFDLIGGEGAHSDDAADYQKAGMALSLAVLQMQRGREQGQDALSEIADCLDKLENGPTKAELIRLFEAFSESFRDMRGASVALSMLAKLLAHTPSSEEERRAWHAMIFDFENRFLTEAQRTAYDFMHQGLSAEEAMLAAEEILKQDAAE